MRYNVKIKQFPTGFSQYQIYKNPVGTDNISFNQILENYDDVCNDYKLNLTEYQKNFLDDRKNKIEDIILNKLKKEKFQYTDNEDNWRRSSTRCKQTLYDYARSNLWDYFATITFNPDIYDRTNYDDLRKKLGQFLNNLKKRKCPNLKYLGVPELHKDGLSWHFHLLLSNCNELEFIQAINGNKDSKFYGLPLKDNNGRNVYINSDFAKLGYCTFTKVSNTFKASNYLCKYLTKQQDLQLSGKKRIVKSNNLDKPMITTFSLAPDDIVILKDSINCDYHLHKSIGNGTLFSNELDIFETN